MSDPLPAEVGTTIFSGLVGKAGCCAWAPPAISVRAMQAAWVRMRNVMVCLPGVVGKFVPAQAGVKRATAVSPSCSITMRSGMSIARLEASTPTMLLNMRGPSSSSTTATV